MNKIFIQFLFSFLTIASPLSLAQDFDWQNSGSLSPSDYLMGSYGKRKDPVFDQSKTIDLSLDLGIGADCGHIDIKHTMRAALKNILDSKYIEDMGRDIVAASPMLAVCYFSPTWCAILKQSQLRASLLANLRLDQCKMIDKFVDSRVEDYEQERQSCVRKQIGKSKGNFEEAMESCKGNHWQADIASWAGGAEGKSMENRLIESSAKWAGFKGKEAERTVSLVKSLIGDTVIKQGHVSVDFGPENKPVTPRNYLQNLEEVTHRDLCEDVLKKIEDGGGYHATIDRVVSDRDLKKISGESDVPLIDHQTIRSLSYLPYKQRLLACRKLSDAIAMTVFTMDMGKSLDFLTSRVETNPHLPEHRKIEAERKRKGLKDQIEVTMALHKNKNEPLNTVLYQINRDGEQFQSQAAERKVKVDQAVHSNERKRNALLDCADEQFCSR